MESETATTAVLESDEVDRRVVLLASLQAELRALKIACVLAGRRRLVLSSDGSAPWRGSGQTNPELHAFVPGVKQVVTTDGTIYQVGRRKHAVDDPAAAAAAICAQPNS